MKKIQKNAVFIVGKAILNFSNKLLHQEANYTVRKEYNWSVVFEKFVDYERQGRKMLQLRELIPIFQSVFFLSFFFFIVCGVISPI